MDHSIHLPSPDQIIHTHAPPAPSPPSSHTPRRSTTAAAHHDLRPHLPLSAPAHPLSLPRRFLPFPPPASAPAGAWRRGVLGAGGAGGRASGSGRGSVAAIQPAGRPVPVYPRSRLTGGPCGRRWRRAPWRGPPAVPRDLPERQAHGLARAGEGSAFVSAAGMELLLSVMMLVLARGGNLWFGNELIVLVRVFLAAN